MDTEKDGRATLLSSYDDALLLNRTYVPIPRDGFCDDVEEQVCDERERFQPLRTIWQVSFYSCMMCTYIVFLVVFVRFENGENTSMIVASTLHVPLLILAGIMEGFIRLQHRKRQSLGYLEFYRATKKLLPIPFQTAAYSVAALLLLQAWSPSFSNIKEGYLIIIVVVIEGLVIAIFDFYYIGRVLRHNRRETLPDAQQYLRSPLTTIADTRRRKKDIVFDNQIEVIRYLQAHVDSLQAEVTRLRELIESDKTLNEGGGLGKDDQKYLIAAGEQRLRAMRAEVETLKRENELVRAELTECKEDTNRLTFLLECQQKENHRLRITLEEWSRRNAKLESRLNKTNEQMERANEKYRREREGRGAGGGGGSSASGPNLT